MFIKSEVLSEDCNYCPVSVDAIFNFLNHDTFESNRVNPFIEKLVYLRRQQRALGHSALSVF